jgi:hypothetical protein
VNRTRSLSACNIIPEPTVRPRVPLVKPVSVKTGASKIQVKEEILKFPFPRKLKAKCIQEMVATIDSLLLTFFHPSENPKLFIMQNYNFVSFIGCTNCVTESGER